MKFIVVLALIFCVQEAGFAQGNLKRPEFEVASVRQAAPAGSQNSQTAGGARLTGAGRVIVSDDRASYQGVTLKRLLTIAYDLKPFQVSGPSWIEAERYDVVATVPEDAPRAEIPVMLQNLLADRFRIVQHTEMKDDPVYMLRVGKSGAKLTPTVPAAPGDHPRAMVGFGTDHQTGQAEIFQNAVTMAGFADSLSRQLDRAVIDQTELAGEFDVKLLVDVQGLPGGSDWPASLFSAVQGVGLKLEPGKAPVKHLVVENAQRVPTEN